MQVAKPEQMPYFFNCVKDPKRLSLVFNSKKALFEQVKELQANSMFGSDFSNELQLAESNVYIRVKEIKNGFNFKAVQGSYKDLKIIYEF